MARSVLTPVQFQDGSQQSSAGAYLPIFLGRGSAAAGPSSVGTAGFWMGPTDGSSIANAALTANPPAGAFQWDAAAYRAAPAGLTAKWRVMSYLYTNATAPGTVTFFIGWRRFTVGGAAGGVAYAMIGSDTEVRQATITNPTGGFGSATADLDLPATASYAATFSWSGTTAANSYTHVFTKLYLVYV